MSTLLLLVLCLCVGIIIFFLAHSLIIVNNVTVFSFYGNLLTVNADLVFVSVII